MIIPKSRHRPWLLLYGVVLAVSACRAGPQSTQRGEVAVPVTVIEVTTKPVPLKVRAVGTVQAKESVAVRAQVSGMLTAIHFTEGATVKAEDLLFTLDARPFRAALHAAQAGLERNRALLAKAEEDARRYAGLVKSGFVTQEQADQTRTTATSLAAAVRVDTATVESAKLQLDYCTIRAPIAGRVGQALVDVGNLVKANDTQPLVMLLKTQPVEIAFSLPESRLSELRASLQEEPLQVVASASGEEAEPQQGKLIFVDNAVDPATGTLLLKAEFENEAGALWPGQFAEIDLILRIDSESLVVPTEAVQNGRDGPYVFVVKPDDKVELRPVMVAREVDTSSVIASGLQAGEVVVRDGQLRLFPDAKIDP